jgi:translocation and assembly module TamA
VRGYSFESLNNKGLGARDLLVGSVEYEQRIFEQWGLAAFYDAGNVANGFSHLTLARGAGMGVRWYSPIGPIKLDAASALSKEGNPWQVDFNVGPEF